MKGLLLSSGGKSSSLEQADLVIINSCGVKGPTEDKILKRAETLLRAGHLLVLTGCLPRISLEQIEKICHGYGALVDTRSIHLVAEVARRVMAGERHLRVFSHQNEAITKSKLELPEPDGMTGIVQISEGCTGHCSYCATKFARGGLLSFPPDDITAAVTVLVQQHGCKDIWFTAQDTGSYCWNGLTLSELINRVMAANRNQVFRLRVGMMNPEHLNRFTSEYAGLLVNEPYLYRFVHVPVQSGSNRILEAMKRKYTVETVKSIFQVLKKRIPLLTVSTDIICGFPGEGEEDFFRSLDLIQWLQPDIVNISRYWPRPGTRAAKLPRLPVTLVKSRSKKLVTLTRRLALERNKNWIDWEGTALVTEKGREETSVLRNDYYKPIVVAEKLSLGQFIHIRVTGANSFYLLGEVLESPRE